MARWQARFAALRAACWRWASRPGDRIALVAENRPEWTIADLAIMSIGAITVPAFTTNTTADHRHVLSHSGAKGVIVSTRRLPSVCCRRPSKPLISPSS